MGVLDRIRKVFGTAKPPEVAAGEAAAGMDVTRPFAPGEPVSPYDGFSRTPRTRDFVTGYNIATRPRTHERVAFDTLKGLIEAYDVAQICIWHRVDSIRALDWSLVPARGFKGDADGAISQGMKALEKPDRETPFATWLAKYLYDILAYDAGALYRMRNRRGDAIGLRAVDGTSVAPLLDYWGNSPEPPAEAYVQYVQGLPWNWLTRDDIIYQPFRPRTNSPYGVAPLETILLNANTDIRFQVYFLQRFTDGNIPEAFASAPESWTPQQIEEFQGYWDGLLVGDQAAKHQIKWMPGGSTIAWSNEKAFEDHFSLFLMRKTAAAYHVVPADLGFTENVNRSSGETQADVQHRVGDLPLVSHVQGILTSFLRDDLGLPVEFAFDTGQEKEDRLALAQAWQIYIESGMASPDEGREQLLGLPGDPGRPTPRFFSTTRMGPIPLLSIEGVAGRVDPETFGPAHDQPVLWQPYVPPPGVVPAVGTADAKASEAAEDTYQSQVRQQLQSEGSQVAKDGPTVGITMETGIHSYDLAGRDDEEDDEADEVAKRELAAFGRYRRARVRAGRWRDFDFRAVGRIRAHRLNQTGRAEVRKAAGAPVAAGLTVVAEDTGRILMLQRALDPDDPAAGTWEFPGGHLDDGEEPLQAAWREFGEETGRTPPPGKWVSSWASTDGVYVGIVWQVPSEAYVPIDDRGQVTNPDDPDGDQVEAIAWWDPLQLPGNPAVRAELLANLDQLFAALGIEVLAKAGGVDPKVPSSAKRWPGWDRDLDTVAAWVSRIRRAMRNAVNARDLAAGWLAHNGAVAKATSPDPATALRWLVDHGARMDKAVAFVHDLWAEGYVIGHQSANAMLTGSATVDWSAWKPGDTKAAQLVLDEAGHNGLRDLLDQAGVTIRSVADNRLDRLAKVLSDALANGDSVGTLAGDLRDVLDDPQWAEAVATTELCRGISAATLDTYRATGVEASEWLTAEDQRVCQTCSGNEDAGPVPIDGLFPSGDPMPPGHPTCRCCLVPVVSFD